MGGGGQGMSTNVCGSHRVTPSPPPDHPRPGSTTSMTSMGTMEVPGPTRPFSLDVDWAASGELVPRHMLEGGGGGSAGGGGGSGQCWDG